MVESAESKWKRPKQHYDLIEIWWVDISAQDAGWKDKVDKIEPTVVHSVGFLVHEDDEHIVIAMDVAHDKEHNQRSQIPKGTVRKISVIRKATSVAKRRTKNVSIQPEAV